MAKRRTKNVSSKNSCANVSSKNSGANVSSKNSETRETVKAVQPKNRPSDSVSTQASTAEKTKKAGTRATTAEATADLAHADRIAATLANVEKLLNQANENSPTASVDLTQLFEKSLKKTHNQISDQLKQFKLEFEQQLNELQQTVSKSLDSKSVARINAKTSEKSNDDAEAEASVKSETDWEARKREMFGEYGQDTPAVKDDAKATETASDSATNEDDKSELASLQESLHDSIESLDEVQAEEIEELRSKLTAKLREAEIELSINRAKLDQQKAKLERQQSELERREKSLASKYPTIGKDGTPQKMGVLDRLTRHLGVRKKVDSL